MASATPRAIRSRSPLRDCMGARLPLWRVSTAYLWLTELSASGHAGPDLRCVLPIDRRCVNVMRTPACSSCGTAADASAEQHLTALPRERTPMYRRRTRRNLRARGRLLPVREPRLGEARALVRDE